MFANPVAVQLYTLRDACRADFAATLRKVAEIGYKAVEFAGFHGLTPAQVQKLLAETGLQAASCHVSLEDLETRLEAVLEDAHLIASKFLVVPYLAAELRSSRADWDSVAERLSTLTHKCRQQGICLAYHNHDFEFHPLKGEPGNGFERLFFSNPSTPLSAELDVYWTRFAGFDPVEQIKRLQGRCPLLHLKDMTAGAAPTFAEVGEGILDWPAILAAAQEAGVQWLVVEQDTCPRSPFDCVEVSLRNVTRLLQPG